MFVRKGTLRKTRGGANRRSTRRTGRSSTDNIAVSRRPAAHDDAIPTGSTPHRLTSNGETNATRSASQRSLTYGKAADAASAHYSAASTSATRIPSSSLTTPVKYDASKLSPARSHTATIVVSHSVLISIFTYSR